jgi:hypothetical protein
MQFYSPFDKRINDIETSDLVSLKQASEGWYIEYKRETPNAASIAKSLSAFANTYGGWFFIGIEEDSKENPVAGAFPGIERTDMDAVLQRMRKAAADLINPTPYFETRVLWGPEDEIALPEDRGIICAWLPQSVTAPHVHKSGVIYRRVADASEPKAESDRFVLDQLWRRADDIKRQHKEWYDRDPEFSEHEKTQPYVRIMLSADIWGEHGIWIDTNNNDQVRSILGASNNGNTIPFDTFYTSGESLIGRQLDGNDPHHISLTWKLRRNCVSDIIIPLPFYQVDTLKKLRNELDGYEHADQFIRILSKYSISTLRIVDLNFMFNVLLGIASIQEQLCKLAEWSEDYHIKIKVLNAWRTIPFIDVLPILDRFEKNGLPMCLDSVVAFPVGKTPTSYIPVPRFREKEDPTESLYAQTARMFTILALSLGFPAWLEPESESKEPSYTEKLLNACKRAQEVQRRRNERFKT